MIFFLIDLPTKPYTNRYVYVLQNEELMTLGLVIQAKSILSTDSKRRILEYYNNLYNDTATLEQSTFYGFSGCTEL